MSADSFDDWCWAEAFFREWASVNVPCGDREAVVRLWQEMGRGNMWNLLCKEEAGMQGTEISFTVDREPEDCSAFDAEVDAWLASLSDAKLKEIFGDDEDLEGEPLIGEGLS